MPMIFENRVDAGRQLAQRLRPLKEKRPIVLALPRGGVPVALQVARALQAPLGLVLVRKIGVPGDEEFALGALADGNPPEFVIDAHLQRALNISRQSIGDAKERALREIERRRAAYLEGRPPLQLAGRHVIVVDDGIATGYTMLAALRAVKRQQPASLTLAVPVAPPDALKRLAALADETVCLHVTEDLRAVGRFYEAFPQLEDDEVIALLAEAGKAPA